MFYVRRFLCRTCWKTTSVLTDEAHPRRCYAGAAILTALVQSVILKMSVSKIREGLCGVPGSGRWRTLERWKAQFLGALWFWKAAELGHAGGGGEESQLEPLLRRFLNRLGATDPYPPDQCDAAARVAVSGTIHDWPERALISRTA